MSYIKDSKGKLLHRKVYGRSRGHFEGLGWDIHHIDGNKLNNLKSNLYELPHWFHFAMHRLRPLNNLPNSQELFHIRVFLQGNGYWHELPPKDPDHVAKCAIEGTDIGYKGNFVKPLKQAPFKMHKVLSEDEKKKLKKLKKRNRKRFEKLGKKETIEQIRRKLKMDC